MKILVYQPNIYRIGGSLSTIIKFADTFKELGHDVKILTSMDNSSILNKEQLLQFYDCKYLKIDDITHRDIKDYDLIFMRGLFNKKPHFHRVSREAPKILWSIGYSEPDHIHAGNVYEVWTNSNYNRDRIENIYRIFNGHVVIPPHDFSSFRNSSKPFSEREIDFIHIARANHGEEKGIDIFATIIKNMNLNGLLITSSNNTPNEKNYLDSLGIPYVCNRNRQQIAEYLGNSKYLLFPSYKESCPLVIYEAMNAGCIPISRDVGAVKEQLDKIGYMFTKDIDIPQIVHYVSRHGKSEIDECIERGYNFDKEKTIINLKERLNRYENQL